MANIPVERTGTPWWVWLLGLLLIAAVIGFLISAFTTVDEVDTAGVPVEDVETVAVAPVVISATDLSSLYVTRVVGDRTFFVTPTDDGTGEETLVILDQNMSPDVGGIEGQVDINAGQMVDLSAGSLEPFGDADAAALGVPDPDSITADTQVLRIDGGDVSIYEQDLENVEVGE